jgi:disulfide bond formation protein DsbB
MVARSSITRIAALTFALAAATIIGAWGFELIGGYKPCALCLQQRWAYYFSLPILALICLRMWSGRADLDVVRWGFMAVVLAMLLNAGLGVYHSGVEWAWWAGPDACSTGAGLSGGLPDLSKARVINCSDAQWRFLGLSFAGWNVVVSLVLAGMTLVGARRTYAYGSSSVSQ